MLNYATTPILYRCARTRDIGRLMHLQIVQSAYIILRCKCCSLFFYRAQLAFLYINFVIGLISLSFLKEV